MPHDQQHGIAGADHQAGTNGTLVGSEGGAVVEKTFGTSATASAIVQRGASGQVTLPATDPVASSDATSKGYVDGLVRGHRTPVQVLKMVDDSLVAAPALGAGDAGKAYVVGGLGGAWNVYAIGDIVEWTGAAWSLILAGAGGEPADGARVIVIGGGVAAGSFLNQGNKIGQYDATANTWSFTAPADGDMCAIIGENSIYENEQYIYDTSSTSWVLMGGTANHNSLAGLQGGTAGEYYHLTQAQHTEAIRYKADVTQAAAVPSQPGTWNNGDRGIIITTTGTRKIWWCYVDATAGLVAVRLS